MQRLEECKADIRQLTSGEREQLTLWLAKGMPDSVEVGAAPTAANDPILNILEMELSELLGHRSALELSGGRGEDIYRLNERIAVKRQEMETRKRPAGPSPSALSGASSVPATAGGTDPTLGRTFERTTTDPFFAGHRL